MCSSGRRRGAGGGDDEDSWWSAAASAAWRRPCSRPGRATRSCSSNGTEAPPEGTADDDFERWDRPGVPQARQSHNFLGLSCAVLSAEAPDVVEALLDRGAMRTDVSVSGRGADPDAGELSLLCRRLVYEAVVRRAVARESGVTIRTGVAAVGLLTHRADHALPIALGVRTDAGDDVEADLVVDSSGRRSPAAQWLEDGGAEVPSTRRAGVRVPLPHPLLPAARRAGVPGHGHPDHHRARLRHGDGLPGRQRHVLAVELGVDRGPAAPEAAATRSASTASSRTSRSPRRGSTPASRSPTCTRWPRIENRWRRLVGGDGRPIVGGLVLVGDSSLHTNPTFGRGVSLAFAQAQHLAATAEQVPADPVGYVHAVRRLDRRPPRRLVRVPGGGRRRRARPDDRGPAGRAPAALGEPHQPLHRRDARPLGHRPGGEPRAGPHRAISS